MTLSDPRSAEFTETEASRRFPDCRLFLWTEHSEDDELALVDIELDIKPIKLPREFDQFLRAADERVYDYLEHSRVRHAGFVPSDFVTVYQALRALVQKNLMTGDTFLEWGSGFGVVASLASMMDF